MTTFPTPSPFPGASLQSDKAINKMKLVTLLKKGDKAFNQTKLVTLLKKGDKAQRKKCDRAFNQMKVVTLLKKEKAIQLPIHYTSSQQTILTNIYGVRSLR